MIRIATSAKAFEAIAKTLPLGSVNPDRALRRGLSRANLVVKI